MTRRSHADPVTPYLRFQVLSRDQGCVAPRLGATDPCSGRLTIEHVRDHAATGGRRAPSDLAHCLTLCLHHHLDGFATSHKPAERRYLRSFEEAA